MSKKLFCILIPMHNEEKVIQATLQSITKLGKVSMKDVYLVDDCSKDDTVKRVLDYGFPEQNVLQLSPNKGKAGAVIGANIHFKLSQRYEWIQFMDADTLVGANHAQKLNKYLPTLDKGTIAVCTEVATEHSSWNPLVVYRQVEYFITHMVYKRAQSELNIITVIPGCGAIFRSPVFDMLMQDHNPKMLTEDMDWTIKVHHDQLGRVIFNGDFKVYTQDPKNIRDYLKQIHRWYRGLWQVYRSRSMWNITKKINAELSLLVLEGLTFSMIWLFGIINTLYTWNFTFTNKFLIFDVALFLVYILLTCIKQGTVKPLMYMPIFYPVRMLTCFVFFYSMVEIFLLQADKWTTLGWNKVKRYEIK